MSYAAPATTGLAALCWAVLVIAAALSSALAFGVWTDEGSGLNSDSMTYYLILMPTYGVEFCALMGVAITQALAFGTSYVLEPPRGPRLFRLNGLLCVFGAVATAFLGLPGGVFAVQWALLMG